MPEGKKGYDPIAADAVTGFLTVETIAGCNISHIPDDERRQIATVLAVVVIGLPLDEIDTEVLNNTINEGYKVAADIEEIRCLQE